MGDNLPPRQGGGQGFASEEIELFPIGGRDASSVLWRPPGIKTTGAVVPNGHKGQFNCGFLWTQRKTKAARGRLIQQPSIRAKACRLLDSERAQIFAVNPHKFGRGKQCTSRGNPIWEGYGIPDFASELDRGPLPFGWVGGSRPGENGFLIKPARRGPVERRTDEGTTWRGERLTSRTQARSPDWFRLKQNNNIKQSKL